MEKDPRGAHYKYFRSFVNPYVGLTAPCDITPLAGKKPFFLHLAYCATKAANSVPELRRRIVDGQVVEYEHCNGSHTIALENSTYCYCELDYTLDFPRFLPYAQEAVEQAKNRASIEEQDPVRLFFISSVPRVSYTGLQLPLPSADFSNPQITFGKAYWQGERYLLPLSLNVHHGLCDGIHISAFFQRFEEICKQVAEGGNNGQ